MRIFAPMTKITVTPITGWDRAKKAALRTAGLKPKNSPDDSWKRRMLLCEHSPIRLLEFDIEIEGIKQWISVHLVRHFMGFIPFVHSQRDDRRKLDCSRDELPQGSLNDMMISANAQALINVSRKRLCRQAHPETRLTWYKVKEAIAEVDPIMAEKMVPECLYRSFCPEQKCCGFVNTEAFQEQLKQYRQV